MNNKEAAKALYAGKTLKIINKSATGITYKFDKETLSIKSSKDGLYCSMNDFYHDNEWEEVKEPYKNEIIANCDSCGYISIDTPSLYPPVNERVNKKYKVTIEEIIE